MARALHNRGAQGGSTQVSVGWDRRRDPSPSTIRTTPAWTSLCRRTAGRAGPHGLRPLVLLLRQGFTAHRTPPAHSDCAPPEALLILLLCAPEKGRTRKEVPRGTYKKPRRC